MSPNSDFILSQELSRRTALKALFGAASAAVLFGLPARARAAEASKETTDKLNAAQAQLDEVQAQLDSIANEYAALANKNAQTLNDIENVQGKIDDTQAQIDEKKAELKKKRNDLSDRVAASYKSGGTNILSLLLASGSFEELVANAHYVEKINKSDRDAIEDIQTIREELDAQKTELEAQKADLEKLKDQQTAQMQDMQAKQQEVQTVLNGLSDDVKELMAQRDSEILAAAQAEEAARKAAAAAAAANKNNSYSGGGSYAPGTPQQNAGSGKQQAVVNACYSTPSPGQNWCAAWVTNVFRNAGVGYFGGNACDMFNAWCYSSDRSALQVGMIVADSSHSGTGAPGLIYGHVGIYVGGGIVMSNEGAITSKSLDSFISFYGTGSGVRWGWLGGIALS
ncbi:tat pathway signal sequence domain protein [Collinsella sp. CAG:166]|nr:tat pathway signal sequence domain protein [Collinsella sp. CAG:166]